MIKLHKIALFTLVALFAFSANAQFKPPRPPDNKAHLRERVSLVRMWKMIERLELNEDQAVQFFPAMNEHEVRMRSIRDKEEQLLDKLETQLGAIVMDKAALGASLDSIAQLRDERFAVETTLIEKVNQILTLEQKAKFLLFDRGFEKEIRSIIDQGLREEEKENPKPFKKR